MINQDNESEEIEQFSSQDNPRKRARTYRGSNVLIIQEDEEDPVSDGPGSGAVDDAALNGDTGSVGNASYLEMSDLGADDDDDFGADDDDGELVAAMSFIERTTAEIARLTLYFQECMCGITLEERQQNIRD
jgi:hypothetical protein